MLILTIRTDNPEAELGLYDDHTQLHYDTWQAHRKLAETLHVRIDALLKHAGKQCDMIQGVVIFQGPGSFTGLRIGLSVGNAIAASYTIPVAGTTGENWLAGGIARLQNGEGGSFALPEYGAPVHITAPRK